MNYYLQNFAAFKNFVLHDMLLRTFDTIITNWSWFYNLIQTYYLVINP